MQKASGQLKIRYRNEIRPIYMSIDRTPSQREQHKKLVEELKSRKSNGESNIVIRNEKNCSNFSQAERRTENHMGQSVQALNCLYANVQSLLNKKSEIELAVAQTYYDLLFFTEVWIPEEAVSTDYYLEGYQTPVICAKARGGTCIYI